MKIINCAISLIIISSSSVRIVEGINFNGTWTGWVQSQATVGAEIVKQE